MTPLYLPFFSLLFLVYLFGFGFVVGFSLLVCLFAFFFLCCLFILGFVLFWFPTFLGVVSVCFLFHFVWLLSFFSLFFFQGLFLSVRFLLFRGGGGDGVWRWSFFFPGQLHEVLYCLFSSSPF